MARNAVHVHECMSGIGRVRSRVNHVYNYVVLSLVIVCLVYDFCLIQLNYCSRAKITLSLYIYIYIYTYTHIHTTSTNTYYYYYYHHYYYYYYYGQGPARVRGVPQPHACYGDPLHIIIIYIYNYNYNIYIIILSSIL